MGHAQHPVNEETRWTVSALHRQLLTLAWQDRITLLLLLIHRPANVTTLAAAMGKPTYAASRHLTALHKAGLITRQARGNQKFYTLAPHIRVDVNAEGIQIHIPGSMDTAITFLFAPTAAPLLHFSTHPSCGTRRTRTFAGDS